ncbi:MAG: serine/threonine protein kinase [Geothrix sp.]|uniref:serine/threonine-protein kinase n=1 Tax=Geothrix sp. TaxID=1962974 RepID=UPI0017E2655F|nr:serine/threonine-protein kinase [Geothrix sp.]NWJ41526.1 serine/threonine protein kinase [Geothrix sp.]WIL20489.1 MAG: serine/threonine protein kinase [Geothrix sp.]
MTLLESDPSPEPGTMPPWARSADCVAVDRYLLGPELGRGGMGRVHAAWDPVLKRVVALKLLLGHDPDLHLRLLREARTQAKLDHPGICRIHDLGHSEGRPYIAMQLVQGRSLVDLHPELDFRAMASVMADVAEAIHAAHLAGLIHRDLKPANILVETRPDGSLRPCVVDFGLARDLTLLDQTLSWAVMGTPAFMSPEQTQGEALGPSTDIYSLGATLYALVTGQPPYEGSTLAGLITNQSDSGVRAVRRLNPGVPRDLETITLKCLEREPARRYGTAKDLGADLRRFLADEPIQARPVGPLGRLWRWSKRRPALAATATTGILASVLLLAWNGHIRATSRLREEAAQRFALEIRDAEHLLRIERMMPRHDIRPAEARLRTRMAAIQDEMARLGGSAQGPAHYALGRGYLALREYAEAVRHLAAAWSSGFQAPEVAHGLALTRLKQYENRRLELVGQLASREDLRKVAAEMVPLALTWMARAKGASVDHPEYGIGLAAQAEGRHDEADRHYALALDQAPWLFEVWGSRAANAVEAVFATTDTPGYDRIHAQYKRALGYLNEAEQIAPSDDEAVLRHSNLVTSEGISQAARHRRRAEPFLEAHRLLEIALRIRPDAEEPRITLPNSALQVGFIQLSNGGDPAPLVRKAAQDLEAFAPREAWTRESDWTAAKGTLHHLWWVVAEADQRFGRSPDQALARARHWRDQVPADPHHAFSRLIEAKHLADRGADPRPIYEETLQVLDSLGTRANFKGTVFYNSTLGQALFERGAWEWAHHRGGQDALRRAARQLEPNLKIDPQFAYTFYHLPRAHALLARMALAAGQDPWPHVKAALATGKQGQAINPDNANLHLAAADALLAEGQARASGGLDATRSWADCRAALALGERANPRDYRLKLLQAEAELAEAEAGGNSTLHLQAARIACQAGLALKRNEPQFRRLLARLGSPEAGAPRP